MTRQRTFTFREDSWTLKGKLSNVDSVRTSLGVDLAGTTNWTLENNSLEWFPRVKMRMNFRAPSTREPFVRVLKDDLLYSASSLLRDRIRHVQWYGESQELRDTASEYLNELVATRSWRNEFERELVQTAKELAGLLFDDISCDECNFIHIRNTGGHGWSFVSQRTVPSYMLQTTEIFESPGGPSFEITYDLMPPNGLVDWIAFKTSVGIRDCDLCGTHYQTEAMEVQGSATLCPECAPSAEVCRGCDYIGVQGQHNEETTRAGETYFLCETCTREASSRLSLRNYSFTPELVFHGERDSLMMGMELEVARNSTRPESNMAVNKWIRELPTDLFFVKSDSSVTAGMEIVTHPFTYDWATANFPFFLFEELVELPGIEPAHSSAGTHIHVEKKAFSHAHMWKFIKFHLENDLFAGMVGGRGTKATYGSLHANKDDLKKKGELKYRVQCAKSGITVPQSGRSLGINMLPTETLELRFMAGNVESDGIKKNIDWVQSVFDFTKKVKVGDARRGALADPGYFLGYLEDHEFQGLSDFLQNIFPTPKKLRSIS